MKPLFLILATLLCLQILVANAGNSPIIEHPSISVAVLPDVKGSDTLDLKRLHTEYGDGNFETVVEILEDFRAKHVRYRLRDSILVAKYLGVVYASNPAAREKGKYWFYKMLQMDPTEELVDLYVGEEVEHVFDKVKQEFIVRRNYRGINDLKLSKSIQTGQEPGKRDTVVRRDTVVVKGDNWASPITDVVKEGLGEVKGGIKAGIKGGYVEIKEEPITEKSSKWTGNVNLGAGLKYLNSEWKDFKITDETEFRFAFDIRQRTWPINIALDIIYDQSSVAVWGDGIRASEVNVTHSEFNVGVRKILDFRLYTVRPFLGGGLGRLVVEEDFKKVSGSEPLYEGSMRDGKISIWLDGGCYWELDKHFNIGLEFLYSNAKIETLQYGPTSHGGTHFDMIAGYHF